MDLLAIIRQTTANFMSDNFTDNNLADTISLYNLRDKDTIDTFRVKCDFYEDSLDLAIGYYIDGQFYQIEETSMYPSQSMELGRGMLVTIANAIFGEVLNKMDLFYPKFKPQIIENNVIADNGKVETIWANIKIRTNLNE